MVRWGIVPGFWADGIIRSGEVHDPLFRDRAQDYARAETLLKAALRRPSLDDRPSVLEWLIDLYDAWDRPEDILPLEQELTALRGPPRGGAP